jgi:hypothetical protein
LRNSSIFSAAFKDANAPAFSEYARTHFDAISKIFRKNCCNFCISVPCDKPIKEPCDEDNSYCVKGSYNGKVILKVSFICNVKVLIYCI